MPHERFSGALALLDGESRDEGMKGETMTRNRKEYQRRDYTATRRTKATSRRHQLARSRTA